jgi:hypothetical protein
MIKKNNMIPVLMYVVIVLNFTQNMDKKKYTKNLEPLKKTSTGEKLRN